MAPGALSGSLPISMFRLLLTLLSCRSGASRCGDWTPIASWPIACWRFRRAGCRRRSPRSTADAATPEFPPGATGQGRPAAGARPAPADAGQPSRRAQRRSGAIARRSPSAHARPHRFAAQRQGAGLPAERWTTVIAMRWWSTPVARACTCTRTELARRSEWPISTSPSARPGPASRRKATTTRRSACTRFRASSRRGELTDFYGTGAYPISYPNEWDKRQGRNGHGIWLHGTPERHLQPPAARQQRLRRARQRRPDASGQNIQIGVTPGHHRQPDGVERRARCARARRRSELRQSSNGAMIGRAARPKSLTHYARDFSTGSTGPCGFGAEQKRKVNSARLGSR